MKKILFIISLLLLSGCGYKYNEITYSELEQKLNNKETFILLLGSDTCSACSKFEKTMKSVMKKTKVTIYYLNINSLSQEDNSKVYSKFVFKYTPTTIFIENGEEKTTYDRIVGAANYDDVIKKLKEKGYIGDK